MSDRASRARLFVPLVVFAVILLIGFIGFDLERRDELPSALLGKPFPEFQAALLDAPGVAVDRGALLGRVSLVNVWATWCVTCKVEHAELMRIAAASDVALIGINYKDDRAKALQWLADYGDPYEFVIVDADGSLGVELGVYGAPETFLVDAMGNIVYKRVGDVNPRIWRDELLPRLRALGVGQRSQPESAGTGH